MAGRRQSGQGFQQSRGIREGFFKLNSESEGELEKLLLSAGRGSDEPRFTHDKEVAITRDISEQTLPHLVLEATLQGRHSLYPVAFCSLQVGEIQLTPT